MINILSLNKKESLVISHLLICQKNNGHSMENSSQISKKYIRIRAICYHNRRENTKMISYHPSKYDFTLTKSTAHQDLIADNNYT